MQRNILVVLAFLSTALAGCGDDAPPAADEEFNDLGLEATDGKGLIRGVVIDEAIVPIAGATIRLNTGEEATSNEDGLFGFSDVEPGTYFLQVSRVGFETVQQSTEVVANVAMPAIVKVQMIAAPGTLPYILVDSYTGWIACEFQTANLLSSCDRGTGAFGEPDSAVYFAIDPQEPDWVQMEVDWKHTQEFGKSLTMTMGACEDDYCSPYGFGDNNLCQNWGARILWCKVGNEESTRSGYGSSYLLNSTGLGTGSTAGISIDLSADCTACTPPETPLCGAACGVGLILEQEFTAYVHVFYNFEPVDKDWIFFYDGPPEGPPEP